MRSLPALAVLLAPLSALAQPPHGAERVPVPISVASARIIVNLASASLPVQTSGPLPLTLAWNPNVCWCSGAGTVIVAIVNDAVQVEANADLMGSTAGCDHGIRVQEMSASLRSPDIGLPLTPIVLSLHRDERLQAGARLNFAHLFLGEDYTSRALEGAVSPLMSLPSLLRIDAPPFGLPIPSRISGLFQFVAGDSLSDWELTLQTSYDTFSGSYNDVYRLEAFLPPQSGRRPPRARAPVRIE